MDVFHKSDLVTDTMFSVTPEFVDQLLDTVLSLGPETTYHAMRLMLNGGAWDGEVLRVLMSYLTTLIKEGPQAMDNSIRASAVLLGMPLPE